MKLPHSILCSTALNRPSRNLLARERRKNLRAEARSCGAPSVRAQPSTAGERAAAHRAVRTRCCCRHRRMGGNRTRRQPAANDSDSRPAARSLLLEHLRSVLSKWFDASIFDEKKQKSLGYHISNPRGKQVLAFNVAREYVGREHCHVHGLSLRREPGEGGGLEHLLGASEGLRGFWQGGRRGRG